ncbi:MAG TPA: sulfotransferase [Streptosporangiaceae bacterium]|nr:sulfotransferase [Streptosporangiaceae bacterium]
MTANGSQPYDPQPSAVPRPPVFVLCHGRSGSTLLRFLLDAHPELACPPETNLPGMAVQLATVWSLIEGAPLSAERGDEPPVVPEAAILGVRRTMDEMTASYLARRGKGRYCDKSLGTARFAELLMRVYPETKFLCLYRHPMDVIASGLEACPWGLNGYGFEQYIGATPGNAVLALARFWAENVTTIAATEERFAHASHRLRYEDLVSDPETVAAGIFEFLGVPQQPGISARCFAPERERFGPADYKIWHTSQVTTGSVGRGWSLPVAMIPPPVLAQVNELAGKLGYRQADDTWGTGTVPADLRVAPAGTASGPEHALLPHPGAALIRERLTQEMLRVDDEFARRWDSFSGETFGVLATAPPGTPTGLSRWRVDLAGRTVTADTSDGEDTAWDIIGSAETWAAVLTGHENLGVALRRCALRYCDANENGPVTAETRIEMLANFLGLKSWGQANQPGRDAGRPAEAERAKAVTST